MCPGASTLKSTRPAGSGGPPRNLLGHLALVLLIALGETSRSRSYLFLPQDPLAQGESSPETPRAAVAPYQKRWGSSIHRWIGVVLSKHQNFHCNGLPELLEERR